jgi:aminoglycoside/choline kinase family phosphotransferase
LQSSNVFCRPDGGILLVDFQGMRLGPAAYDLASLLCDAYVSILDDAARMRLLERYARALPGGGGDAIRLFPWAAVQRLVQALGAFGRLTELGIPRFAAFIPPAAATLRTMAERCGLRHLARWLPASLESDRPAPASPGMRLRLAKHAGER